MSGHVFKYGDSVDTDVILPARYLALYKEQDLAAHCMEDLDADFVKKYFRVILSSQGKILAAVHRESMPLSLSRPAGYAV